MYSLLICSYNKSRSLQAVLTNLNGWLGKKMDIPFEVIVIDDGSTDDTARIIEKTGIDYPFSYYRIDHSGLSGARNAGIRKCRGEYVVFCDDDVLMDPGYLESLDLSVRQHPSKVHIG